MIRLSSSEPVVFRMIWPGGPFFMWLRGQLPLECPPFCSVHIVPPGLPHCLCERLIVDPEEAQPVEH